MRRVRIDRVDDGADARARPPVVPHRSAIGVGESPSVHGVAPAVVAPVAVDEQEPPEALPGERVEQVAQQRAVRLDAQRRAAGVRREVRRQAERERRQHEHAQRIRCLDRDPLRQDPVDAEREVAVLLDRAEREHEPIVALQVALDLHPVAVLDPHRATSSYARATASSSASSPDAAASCNPTGSVPAPIPHGTETAGIPARL